MEMIYAHELATQAFGWKANGGGPCPSKTHCILSGAPLQKGEPAVKWKIPSSFTDDSSLVRDRGEYGWVHPACLFLLEKGKMMRLQNAAFTATQSFTLTKGVYRKHFLLNPPNPPFVIGMSDVKLGHVVWRLPVTLDANFWHVRLGQRLFTLHRSMALEASAICDNIVARWVESAGKKSYVPSHPFLNLDASAAGTGNVSDLSFARYRADFIPFIEPAEHRLFSQMGLGEFWALGVLQGVRGDLEAPPALEI